MAKGEYMPGSLPKINPKDLGGLGDLRGLNTLGAQ